MGPVCHPKRAHKDQRVHFSLPDWRKTSANLWFTSSLPIEWMGQTKTSYFLFTTKMVQHFLYTTQMATPKSDCLYFLFSTQMIQTHQVTKAQELGKLSQAKLVVPSRKSPRPRCHGRGLPGSPRALALRSGSIGPPAVDGESHKPPQVLSRSFSREVRIRWYPTFFPQSISVGEPSQPKTGVRKGTTGD